MNEHEDIHAGQAPQDRSNARTPRRGGSQQEPHLAAGKEAGPDERLAAMTPGQIEPVQKISPSGTLMARKATNGKITFFWRSTFRGNLLREPIGTYSETANRRWSKPAEDGRYCVLAAVAKASELAIEHEQAKEIGGLKGKREGLKQAAAAAIERENAERRAAEQLALSRTQYSLAGLLEQYCRSLEKRKASSAKEVRNALNRNVIVSTDDQVRLVAALPAKEVDKSAIITVLAPIYAAGHGRQANKVRSYLSAAYEFAIEAAGNAATASEVRSFEIEYNPVSSTSKNAQFNRADKNPLTLEEMREYWTKIKDLPGNRGACLRVHLLLGAPRIQQLVRTHKGSIKTEGLQLIDIKGRSAKPRSYELPVPKALDADLATLSANSPFLMSTDGGRTPLANTTLSEWAKDAVGDSIPDFELKRTRSGVETLLADLKVNKEVRGKLQSHGNGGVQDTFYNDAEYRQDKIDALRVLYKALTSRKPPRISRMRRRR